MNPEPTPASGGPEPAPKRQRRKIRVELVKDQDDAPAAELPAASPGEAPASLPLFPLKPRSFATRTATETAVRAATTGKAGTIRAANRDRDQRRGNRDRHDRFERVDRSGGDRGERSDRLDPRTRDRLAQQRQENYTFNENHRVVINDLAAMSIGGPSGKGRRIRPQPRELNIMKKQDIIFQVLKATRTSTVW